MIISIILLAIVFVLIAVRQIGRLKLQIWQIMLFGALAVLLTGQITILDSIKAVNIDVMFFLFGMFLYVAVVATASVRHDYYQIFTIPAISLTLASGTVFMWQAKNLNKYFSRLILIFSLVLMLGTSLYQVKEFYKINHPEIIEAGNALDKIAPKDVLVIAPYNGDTAFLYQTKRHGWPAVDDSFENIIKKGASFYVTVNQGDSDTKYVVDHYKVVEKTDKYLIADLRQKIK